MRLFMRTRRKVRLRVDKASNCDLEVGDKSCGIDELTGATPLALLSPQPGTRLAAGFGAVYGAIAAHALEAAHRV